MSVEFARWIAREDGKRFEPVDLRNFDKERVGIPVMDVRDRPVVLFAGDWQLNSAKRTFSGIRYQETAQATQA